MAKALLMSGGVGGVSSDDVTARREHVLQGYTALTSDSNDEPAQGTMVNRGTWSTASEVVNAPWENTVHTRFEEGYYPKDGNFKPTAKIPYAMLVNALGIDSSKMLDTLTVAGKQGQIKSIDTAASNFRVNKSTAFGIDNWTNPSNPVFYVDFPHGSAYYTRPDGHPHVCIDAINLGDVTADKVMRGFTATSKNGVKFAGTMPDLQSGRTVFNGATFDNELVSGVADKPFFIINDYYANYVSNEYRYSGIWGGGMNFSLTTFSPALLGRKIGCVLSKSIDLSPFSRIDINYNLSGTVKNNPNINLECFVSPLRSLKRAGKAVQGAGNIDGFSEAQAVVRAGNIAIDRQGQLTLDVRNINEQAFLSLTTSITVANSRESFSGALQITKIEFIN